MTEADFWSRYVRPALNRPPLAKANKVQDRYNGGLPDAEYCIMGQAGKIEMKYIRERPKRATTPLEIKVSTEQRRQLSEWHDAGGNAFVLLGVERQWYLLSHLVPRKILEQDLGPYTLESGTLKQLDRLYNFLAPAQDEQEET